MNGDSTPESPDLPTGTELKESSSRDLLTRVHAVEFSTYSGPIPPPDLLQRFDEVYPGAAKQILDDFVQESAHRRSMERKVISAESFKEVCGPVFAGLIGMSGAGGGIWLIHEGRATGGLSSILATLASLVGVYLYQTRRAASDPDRDPADRNGKGIPR